MNPHEGDELETALRQMIVGGAGPLTTGAYSLGIAARPDLDFDGVGFRAQVRLLIDETWKALTVIQKGDQLHGNESRK